MPATRILLEPPSSVAGTAISTARLGVVCPMANEAADAIRFVDEVLAQCSAFGQVRFYAVLDNATKDDTVGLLLRHSLIERRLDVVWAPENRCVVDAYIRGYREALAGGADWILEIDAGFSHDPADIPKFWHALNQGYDCVFGSRFIPGGGFIDKSVKRFLVSKGGSILSNLLLGTRMADMTSGFELFRRDVLEMVLDRGIQSRAHFFQTEIKAYCRKLNVTEVPIHYRTASPRLSHSAVSEAFAQLWRLFKLRRNGQL